ncbi:3D domain-containing protein [Lacticaseibacillus saniviri]|nr:3D domain-containing protein [Lacticaseibacillus saniviri]MCG4282119.1 3D domain-containing protein [Lacticaseibacillus saniviri]
MKLKSILLTLVATASLGFTVSQTTTANQTVHAATAIATKTVSYVPNYGIAVYKQPAGAATSQTLKHGTNWKIYSYKTVNGVQWASVGTNQWVQAAYMKDFTSNGVEVKYVNYKENYGIAVYRSPYTMATTGQTLKHGTSWKVNGYVTTNGKKWANIGTNQWVQAAYLSSTVPVAQAPARTMTATAYDPRILGNYTFGYDTVAANLSVFPRGTKLAITFANGTTKTYVVRDTGGFAYANPNQLDIAMPNSQALQFGRQTISVRVIK